MDKTQLPIETTALIDDITEICWEHLLDHQQDDFTQIYYSTKTRSFSYIRDSDDYKPISIAEAIAILESLITIEIILNQKVFLYTCRDNALISIDPTPNADEDLDLFTEHYENIFYIGYDD